MCVYCFVCECCFVFEAVILADMVSVLLFVVCLRCFGRVFVFASPYFLSGVFLFILFLFFTSSHSPLSASVLDIYVDKDNFL